MKYNKRYDGRYCTQIMVGYRDDGKKILKSLYGKTVKELEKKEIKFRNELAVRRNFTNDDMTVDEWSKIWLKTYKNNVSRNTYKMYENIVNNHIANSIGNIKLIDLKPMLIQTAINDIISIGHIRIAELYKLTIRQILKQATAEGLISNNVCDHIQKIKSKQTEKKPLSEFEIMCIKNTKYTPREKLFLDIMYYTGLRRGEVLALKRSDIDIKNKRICVTQSLDIAENTPVLKSTKSEAGKRKIPIPNDLYSELSDYIKENKTFFLFTSSNGDLLTKSAFRRMWKKIVKKTNKTAVLLKNSNENKFATTGEIKFTPHRFRHTYATNLYYAGVDIKTAQYLLGHSTLNMTLKVYTHLDSEKSQRFAKEKLDEFFEVSQNRKKLNINLKTKNLAIRLITRFSYGEPSGIRIPDNLIKSQVLCQLS